MLFLLQVLSIIVPQCHWQCVLTAVSALRCKNCGGADAPGPALQGLRSCSRRFPLQGQSVPREAVLPINTVMAISAWGVPREGPRRPATQASRAARASTTPAKCPPARSQRSGLRAKRLLTASSSRIDRAVRLGPREAALALTCIRWVRAAPVLARPPARMRVCTCGIDAFLHTRGGVEQARHVGQARQALARAVSVLPTTLRTRWPMAMPAKYVQPR